MVGMEDRKRIFEDFEAKLSQKWLKTISYQSWNLEKLVSSGFSAETTIFLQTSGQRFFPSIRKKRAFRWNRVKVVEVFHGKSSTSPGTLPRYRFFTQNLKISSPKKVREKIFPSDITEKLEEFVAKVIEALSNSDY